MVGASGLAIGAPFASFFRVCEEQVAGSQVVTVCQAPSVGATPLYIGAVLGALLFAPEIVKLARAVRTISIELGQLKVSAELEAVKQAVEVVRESTTEASVSVASLVAEQKRRRVEEIPSFEPQAKAAQLELASTRDRGATPGDESAFLAEVDALANMSRRLQGDPQTAGIVKNWRTVFSREIQSLEDAASELRAGEFVSPDVLHRAPEIARELREVLEDQVSRAAET